MTAHTFPPQQPPHGTDFGQTVDLPIINVEANRTFTPLPITIFNKAEAVDGTPSRVTAPKLSVAEPTVVQDQNAIQHVRFDAQQRESNLNVYLSPNGDILAADQEPSGYARLSAVVGDTFYSLDLNAIQQATLAAQRNGGEVADKDRVYVDQNGEVMLGSDVGNPSRASEVVGDIFYARDLVAEARAVAKMPLSVKVSDGAYEGYSYSITNRFADRYDLFIYYHPTYSVYRVALVSPRLGGELDVHGGHLFSDGTLCLTQQYGSGYPSMEETYAKSALWTLGASLYRRGYGFQFNIGQDGDSRA